MVISAAGEIAAFTIEERRVPMKSIIVSAAVAGLAASCALASPLLPNGSVSPIPVYTNSIFSATAASAYLSVPFAAVPLYSGTLNSQVFINMPDNPYGPGFLSFAYQVTNNAGSANSLGRITINGYTGFGTDVGSDPGSMATFVDAFEATRQADGSSIGFSFLNLGPYTQVGPNQVSRIFVVHTNATQWQILPASVIDGDVTMADAYAPLPTPGAGAVLGLGTLAAFRRRR